MYQKLLQEILEFKWFKPESKLSKSKICELAKMYQEKLKPFGFGTPVPCQFIRIWPGQTPIEIIQLRMESKKHLMNMFLENIGEVVREVAVDSARMSLLDMALRDVETKLKNVAHDFAIEATGATVKATVTMPIISPGTKEKALETLTEFDIIEKAIEDAVAIAGRYIAWRIVEDHLTKKKYTNPFTHLMELFKMGLWPLGIVQNQYVILIPGGTRTMLF
jgi:hypothetical protein